MRKQYYYLVYDTIYFGKHVPTFRRNFCLCPRGGYASSVPENTNQQSLKVFGV
jgi:hypothetical protein